ncbi:MAG: hypothetical protein IJZ79_02450 [Bacilli bacterium]|nr:hypothetical protein [Bacilli bacterium]
MYKDLRKVDRPTRKKPGMQDFFILILVYSYYNRNSHNVKNEFSIPQSVLADYYDCSVVTVKRWFQKLRDIDCIKYAERENAGRTAYYKEGNAKKSYVIPKYKKIRCGELNDIKFLNIYILDQQKLNQYLLDTVDIDVLNYIDSYKHIFDNFITFLSNRNKYANFAEILKSDEVIEEVSISQNDKSLKRALKIKKKISENQEYLNKKRLLDTIYPDFQCKYLEEGCLRLTHEICSTVNPEHLDKINDNNYWRSRDVRNNMLRNLLSSNEFIEYDINGSIYRLTYNLYHNHILAYNEDIYELIWKNCSFYIEWPENKRDEYRKAFKIILMPLYMREYTLGYRANQWEYINKYYAEHPRKYNRLSRQEKEFFETYKLFVDLLQLNLKDILLEIANSMHSTLNTTKFIGSDIFIHESNLHILIREKLMQHGIKCVNVYDGFYVKKDDISKSQFQSIYNESLLELKSNLKNGIGSNIYGGIIDAD